MTIFAYQGVPASLPPPTVAVVSGGSITAAKAGAYYFWLQARNLSGFNSPSSVVAVTLSEAQITAGNAAIAITISSSTRPVPNGCCIWEYIVMAATVNNVASACVVGTVPGYELDGTTLITLPATLTLFADEHLEFNAIAADLEALPEYPINGMRRYLETLDDDSSFAKIVEWNSRTSGWDTTYPQGFNTNVTSITGPNGALRDAEHIDDERIIKYPAYSLNPDNPHRSVGYWLINNGSTAIPATTRVGFSFKIGDENISNVTGIVGSVELRFLGYVDVATGVLDTSSMSVNVPIPYQGEATGLPLQKDLPAGSAIVFTVQSQFSTFELPRKPANGSLLRIYAQFFVERASYTPLDFVGTFISQRHDRRRIVPQDGMSVLALKGSGCIEMAEGGSLCFNNVSPQAVFGLLANTADQLCAITVNGTCLFLPSLTGVAGAGLRAIVSTVNGYGHTTSWSTTTIGLNDTVLLKVSITNPTTIRDDYPDVIAGSPIGEFNGTTCEVYIKNASTGEIWRFEQAIPPGIPSYTITVGDADGDLVGTSTPEALAIDDLPQPSDLAFGMFKFADDGYSSTIIAGTSTFTTGNYYVALTIGYLNTPTTISHDPIYGCIPEMPGSIPNMFQNTKYWSQPTANLAGMRSLTTDDVYPNQVRMVRNGGMYEPYIYDQLATETDDLGSESEFVRVSGVSADDPGRFKAFLRVRRSLILKARSTPPTTRADEIAVFVDADNLLRQRAPSNGLISTVGSDGAAGGGIQSVSTEAELLLLATSDWAFVFLVRNPKTLLYFDPASTAAHNGVTVFRPTAIAEIDPGRWRALLQPSYDNILVSSTGEIVVDEDGNIMTEVI